MSTAQHTPGPWEFDHRRWMVVGNIDSNDEGGFTFNEVCTLSDNDEGTDEANGRLIAAAPELLAKLAETRRHLPIAAASWNEGIDENPGYSIHVDAVLKLIAEIDALIAKASGVSA